MHYLVLNGRAQPYRADAPAKLSFEVRGVMLRRQRYFSTTSRWEPSRPRRPPKPSVSFDIPSDRLAKVNRVTVRTDGSFRFANVKLEYKKHSVYDLRYAVFEPHDFNKATSASSRPEDALYFCLP